ncbi:hypothetical protein K435DRAFT_759879 [Dendrothele bispora CBS 962.96]|uniref:GST N-terminal domain-containing protein n=1 Tax=Dendrothele bispora (strain CBS 962.96) TaxID=1314807 RepID=A0A4S8LNX3_DENBC|nr:hypothetical protein K435DRAFT_759879 [Dendrothele bispora CBS 962.96]
MTEAGQLKPLILYDFSSKKPGVKGWNPNVWKARYSLNYKGLPYKTIWVEYPDVASTLETAGCPPNPVFKKPDGSPMYTLPAIVDPNTGACVSESLLIAVYLDKTYPDKPTLIPAGTRAFHEALLDAFMPNTWPSMRFMMLKTAEVFLNPKSEVYFREHRKYDVLGGVSVEDAYPKGDEVQVVWKQIEDGMNKMATWMDKGGYKFVMGDKISFADFVFAGFLQFNKKTWGEESKEWKDMSVNWDGGRWGKLLKDLKEYERDD